jgi:hypothetical protein
LGLKQGAIALVDFLEQLHTFQGFVSERLIENLRTKKEFSVAPSYWSLTQAANGWVK